MHPKTNETDEKILLQDTYYEDSAIFSSNITVKKLLCCLGKEKVVIVSGVTMMVGLYGFDQG